MNANETDEQQMGRVNYDAWCDAHGGEDHSGHKLLTWNDLSEWMRKPWIAAAQAVARRVKGTDGTP